MTGGPECESEKLEDHCATAWFLMDLLALRPVRKVGEWEMQRDERWNDPRTGNCAAPECNFLPVRQHNNRTKESATRYIEGGDQSTNVFFMSCCGLCRGVGHGGSTLMGATRNWIPA